MCICQLCLAGDTIRIVSFHKSAHSSHYWSVLSSKLIQQRVLDVQLHFNIVSRTVQYVMILALMILKSVIFPETSWYILKMQPGSLHCILSRKTHISVNTADRISNLTLLEPLLHAEATSRGPDERCCRVKECCDTHCFILLLFLI